MTNPPKFVCVLGLVVVICLPVWGQVLPVPLPGGDALPPYGLFNQFFPGVGTGYDGRNADPNGITNFNGVLAMGYTLGTATDSAGNTYAVITDIRVYQGDYVGAVPNGGAGRTKSAHAHGTFVEIWIDLWDTSLVNQLHDFNPGITPNGVFWMVQVPDSAVQISGDTLTINLQNVVVVDQLQFPTGTGHAPVTLSFTATYTKSGSPREVHPTSRDPLSPFTWEGEIWTATNTGSFSATYNDGSFSAQGNFSSSGFFGEMGTEKNGSYVREEDSPTATSQLSSEDRVTKAASKNEGTSGRKLSIPLKGRILTTSSMWDTEAAGLLALAGDQQPPQTPNTS